METAKGLWADHPEVIMYQRRCLGDAESLYAKAKALTDAGDDKTALAVRHGVPGLHELYVLRGLIVGRCRFACSTADDVARWPLLWIHTPL